MRQAMIEQQIRDAEFARGREEEAAAAQGRDPLMSSPAPAPTPAPAPAKPQAQAKPTKIKTHNGAESLTNLPEELALSNRVETLADTVTQLRLGQFILKAECLVEGLPVFNVVPQTKKELVESATERLSKDQTVWVQHPNIPGACGLVFMTLLSIPDPRASRVTVQYVPIGVSSSNCAEGANAVGATGKKEFLTNYSFA